MLTRPLPRGAGRIAVALLLVLAGLLGTAGTASASVSPCDNSYLCVVVGTPGSGGGTQGGGSGGPAGGSGACTYNHQVVPCSIAGIGSLDPADGCYYIAMEPQPPAGDPLWQGHQPGDGAIYVRTCALNGGGGTVSLWMAAAPPVPVQISPLQLAHLAVSKLKVAPATLMTAPEGAPGLVNVPVMLWLKPTQGMNDYGTTYAPSNRRLVVTASVPGLSVTAWVWSSSVTWTMGDGTTFSCPGPGADYAYTHRYVGGCSTHTYRTANHGYAISGLVGWTVFWSGGGQSGAFFWKHEQAVGTVLKVEEIQVLN